MKRMIAILTTALLASSLFTAGADARGGGGHIGGIGTSAHVGGMRHFGGIDHLGSAFHHHAMHHNGRFRPGYGSYDGYSYDGYNSLPMGRYETILETVGHAPVVRINPSRRNP